MKLLKFRLFWPGSFLLAILFMAGCAEQKNADALDSDANGYQCPQCNLKYYTDRTVFANYCPGCKTGTALRVVGFVCPKDKQVTIVSQTRDSAPCEQCKATVSEKKIPREAELKAWGAVKKTQQEVN
jgi:hypothetical protein